MQSSFANRAPISTVMVAVLLCFSLLLSACGSDTPGTGGTQTAAVTPPKTLISAGTLTVGSDTTYPPQEFIDTATRKATGFDIDLITEIGNRMGLKTNVITAKFDGIIEGLSAKRYDVVISAITINDERKQKADFVPYFKAGSSLLVQTGNPRNLKTVADLCGLEVGVQTGTVQQTELEKANNDCKAANKAEIKLTILQDQTAVVQLLATNRVVATYQDSPVTDYYIKQNGNRFQVGGSIIDAAEEGIVIRKGDTEMLNAVQKALDLMRSDGTYKKLIDKWGLQTGAL